MQAILKVPSEYRDPVVLSARAAAAPALLLAAWAAWTWGHPSLTTIAALWILCGLYVLIGLEMPRASIAYAAVSCAAVAAIHSIRLATVRGSADRRGMAVRLLGRDRDPVSSPGRAARARRRSA